MNPSAPSCHVLACSLQAETDSAGARRSTQTLGRCTARKQAVPAADAISVLRQRDRGSLGAAPLNPCPRAIRPLWYCHATTLDVSVGAPASLAIGWVGCARACLGRVVYVCATCKSLSRPRRRPSE